MKEEDESTVPPEFWDLCDRFIGLANELAEQWPRERVSATLLYAAARYNAFVAVGLDPDAESNQEQILEYFRRQYAEMLADNVRELLERADESSA